MKKSKILKNELTKTTLKDDSHYMLYNTSNYKLVIENSVSEILDKFIQVVLEYMRFNSEKIIIKNKIYYSFIFERGIETLIHVFLMIFHQTKNLELTFYHTQKAYYFYIEFIEQISDDNITFLQLTSQDAISFVYKKTIFELNNEYRKNMKNLTIEEKQLLDTVNNYVSIYKNLIIFIINRNNLDYENKQEYINTSCNCIEFISQLLNKNKINHVYIDCLYIFVTVLSDKQIKIPDYFRLVDEFIKKLTNKKKIDKKIITNKIYDSEINNFIDNNETNKIVEWIFLD